MDLDNFRRRIRESISYVTASNNNSQWQVDDYTDRFELDVTQILDTCVPLRSTTKRVGIHTSRFLFDEARSAKQACRRAERRFRRTGLTSDKANYKKARKTARLLIDESRVSQIRKDIAEADGDPKRLWCTTKQLLHPHMPTSMNDSECATMASNFCSIFFWQGRAHRDISQECMSRSTLPYQHVFRSVVVKLWHCDIWRGVEDNYKTPKQIVAT